MNKRRLTECCIKIAVRESLLWFGCRLVARTEASHLIGAPLLRSKALAEDVSIAAVVSIGAAFGETIERI